LTKDQLAEILVGRQEHIGLLVCKRKDNVIGNALFHLGSVPYRVTVPPQAIHDLTIHALVGQEIHPAVSATG